MTKFKRIMLTLCTIVGITLASVIGFVCFNHQELPIGGGHYQNSVEDTNTLHFSEGEVAIQKGSSNLNYKYEPSTNARGRTVAFEYAFHNPMPNVTQAVSLKSIDSTNVTLSYAYFNSKQTSITSSNTKFELQEIPPDSSKYIYILVTLSIAMPTDFQSNVVWYQGLPGSVTLVDANGNETIQPIVKGQEINRIFPINPSISGYNFEGFYRYEHYMDKVEDGEVTQGGIKLYPRVPNLPTDWLALDTSTNTYYVTKGSSDLPTNLVIPEYYNGKAITYVQASETAETGVFYNRDDLLSVSLPNTMTTVGKYAFYNCDGITGIVVPKNITSLERDSFNACDNIYEIWNFSSEYMFPGGWNNSVISWRAGAVYTEPSESKLVTIDNVLYCALNENEYVACKLLEGSQATLTLDSRTVLIRTIFAQWRTDLKIVDLSNCTKLTEIYHYAFLGSGIEEIIFPSSLKYLHEGVFQGCTALKEVKLPEGFQYFSSGYAFNGCDSLTSITLPSTVYGLNNRDFHDCANLTSVDLSACTKLTSIGKYVFRLCPKLQEVKLPSSITTIGQGAFESCTSLTDINLEDTQITSIGQNAFYNCCSLPSIVIPSTVTSILSDAFDSCHNLAEVWNLSSSLTIVTEDWANGAIGWFASVIYTTNCDSALVEINGIQYYPESTSSYIAVRITDQTKTTISFDSRTTKIRRSFANRFTNKNNVTSIDFSGCVNLTKIGHWALYAFSKVTLITLPNTITILGEGCIAGSGITNITIPSSVAKIGYLIFSGCSSLKSVIFEDTSTWYVTTSSVYQDGSAIDVSDATQNAQWFSSSYNTYWWYRQ